MLFVELRSFNQILLEISSHGSTKKVNVTLKAILILCDTKYFVKPWKMLGLLVIVLLVERFGFG